MKIKSDNTPDINRNYKLETLGEVLYKPILISKLNYNLI